MIGSFFSIEKLELDKMVEIWNMAAQNDLNISESHKKNIRLSVPFGPKEIKTKDENGQFRVKRHNWTRERDEMVIIAAASIKAHTHTGRVSEWAPWNIESLDNVTSKFDSF